MDKFAALVRWRRARDAGLAGKPLPAPPGSTEEPATLQPSLNPFAGLFGNASEE